MKKQSERRTKGTGSLFKRNGKFVYQWTSITGKVKTKTLRASSREDALKEINSIVETEIQLAAIDSKISYMHQVAEAKALLHVCRIPLSQLEEAFFNHPSAPIVSVRHRKNYHSVLKSFIEFASQFHIATVADVSEETAQAFLAFYWQKGVAPKTYNSVLNILKCVFRLLSRDNNPFESFSKKSVQTEERVAFSVEQLQQIWDTLNSPDYHMLYKEEMIVLYKLALYTGARCGDLCLLRWSSVDMQNRVIRFIPHKTAHSSHKIVEIPIGPVLFEALSAIDRSFDYVLPNVASRYQRNSGGIARDTKKLLIAAGLTPTDEGTTRRVRAVSRMGFHGFRHTAASLLISNGVNPLVVRDLLGHTSVDMTAHYTHINLETKREALQNLNVLPCLPQTDHIESESYSLESKRQVIASLPLPQKQVAPHKNFFASRLPVLSSKQLAALGEWLDQNLPEEIKEKMFRQLL